jgi:hypothetical protein
LSEPDLAVAVPPRARNGDEAPADEEPRPVEIEQEIEELRAELGGLVAEIDRRRHEALDLRLQLRRHAPTVIVLLGGATLLFLGLSTLRSYRRQRLASARVRAGNLARALQILSQEDPDRLLRRSPDPRAAALAALARVAGAAGRRVVNRTL